MLESKPGEAARVLGDAMSKFLKIAGAVFVVLAVLVIAAGSAAYMLVQMAQH